MNNFLLGHRPQQKVNKITVHFVKNLDMEDFAYSLAELHPEQKSLFEFRGNILYLRPSTLTLVRHVD